MFRWDGTQWVSTLSADSRYRWNGASWEPYGVAAPGAWSQQARPLTVREPTSWTRPLQYAVAAWYGFSALYTASIPFWMGGLMNQIMNQAIERQQAQGQEALPPGFADAMTSMMTGIFWGSAIFGIALSVLAIVGALRRWTWLYYVVLVLLGLGVLGLPINLINAFAGGAVSSAEGFTFPVWTAWVGIATGLVGAALVTWMLIALFRFGPWAMRKVS